MKGNIKIKVIKKNALEIVNKPPVDTEKNTQQKIEKKMVSTISDWVDEFQQNRHEGAKHAFEQLFTQPLPQIVIEVS